MYDVLPMTLLMLTGIFLILIVLLQRGRGGGLAGAFGGAGGQSAFGTKAGDVFTKITVVIAVIWVVLAGASGFGLRAGAESRGKQLGDTSIRSTETIPGEEESPPVKTAPKDDGDESADGEKSSGETTDDGDTNSGDRSSEDSSTGENGSDES